MYDDFIKWIEDLHGNKLYEYQKELIPRILNHIKESHNVVLYHNCLARINGVFSRGVIYWYSEYLEECETNGR